MNDRRLTWKLEGFLRLTLEVQFTLVHPYATQVTALLDEIPNYDPHFELEARWLCRDTAATTTLNPADPGTESTD